MGTCELYRKRVQKVIFSLKHEHVYWPDKEERSKLSELNRVKYQCPNVILTADGTLIQLAFEPQCADYSADCYGRKLQWSITMFIIGDDNCKIRYHLTEFPGSSHDNRVWKWSKIYKERRAFFSPLQCIIMDTAFEPCEYMVPGTKRDKGTGNSDAQLFIHVIAKPRVRSEYLRAKAN